MQLLQTKIENCRFITKWHKGSLEMVSMASLSLVKVEIGEVARGVLWESHLLVIVDDPATFFLDVTYIVTNHCWGSHMADESHQFVFWNRKCFVWFTKFTLKKNALILIEWKTPKPDFLIPSLLDTYCSSLWHILVRYLLPFPVWHLLHSPVEHLMPLFKDFTALPSGTLTDTYWP